MRDIMTVFVTQENLKLNYSDAERFGEIVFLTAREYSASPNSLHNKQTRKVVSEKLAVFNLKEDYLLLSGSPIIMCFAYYLIAIRHLDGTINLLKWNGYNKQYDKIAFEIGIKDI